MRQWFELAGTVGSIVCDDFVLALSEEKSRFWVHDDQQKATVRELGPFTQQVGMIEDFHACLEKGEPDPAWPTESIRTQRVLDALLKSARIRQPVELE
jgi:predicted dehydrogenase